MGLKKRLKTDFKDLLLKIVMVNLVEVARNGSQQLSQNMDWIHNLPCWCAF
jgi:hypothetical protein